MVVWEESVGDWGPGLLDALNGIGDPRKPKGVRHPLPAVLAMSVCAMLGGARSLYAIAQVGPGTPPVCPVPGVQPGADPVRGHAASCIPPLGRGCLRVGPWPLGPGMPGRGREHHCHRRQGPAGDTRAGTARGETGGGIRWRERPGTGTKGGSGGIARRVNWGWPRSCWPGWISAVRWLPGTRSTRSGS